MSGGGRVAIRIQPLLMFAPMVRRAGQWATGVIVYGALFALLFHAASVFEVRPEVSAWFPAVGLRLALLLLLGWRFALTAWVAEVSFGLLAGLQADWIRQIPSALSFGSVGMLLSAGISPLVYGAAAWLIRQAGWLHRPGPPIPRLVSLLLSAAAASAVAALLATANLVVTGILSWTQFAPAVFEWWLGDLIGILTVTPAALIIGHALLRGHWPRAVLNDLMVSNGHSRASAGSRLPRGRLVLECLLASGVALPLFAVAKAFDSPLHWYPFFLPIIWLALRFGLTGAATGNLVSAACVATVASLPGRLGSPVDIQMFMILLSVAGLLIGGLVSTLKEERARLDQRVHARTRKLRNESELRRSAEIDADHERHRAETFLSLARTPIVATDNRGRVILINEEGCALLGFRRADVIGRSWLEVAVPSHERARVRAFFASVRARHHDHGRPFESEVATKDGQRRLIDWRATVLTGDLEVPDTGGEAAGVLLAGLDITERAANERRIRFLADHDRLTGLLNRNSLAERFPEAIAMDRRRGRPLALLFIDLDGFKTINDALGHDVGDWVIREVAHRLKRAVRQTDTVVRFGGDEFVIVLENIDGPRAALLIAAGLREKVVAPMVHPGGRLRVGASVGIAMFPEHGRSLHALLRSADAAMYRAKKGAGVALGPPPAKVDPTEGAPADHRQAG